MRFQVSTSSGGGLRVIPAIPEGRLLRLQGRNGIGKTLAIRLLQLATGDQPYFAMPSAWATLKESLGETVIEVAGLKNGDVLSWTLRPVDWPDRPRSIGPWLGQVSLNGRTIAIGDVPAVLRVLRIGGDETLSQSLAQQIQADLEQATQLFSYSRPALESVDSLVLDAETTVGDFSIDRLVEIRRQCDQLEARARAQRRNLSELAERGSNLEEAVALLDRVSRLQARRPSLLEAEDKLATEEEQVSSRLDDITRRLAAILHDQRQSASRRQELARLERLYRLRRDRRERRIHELRQALGEAGLPPASAAGEVNEVIQAVEAERLAIDSRRRLVDVAGLLIEVIDDLSGRLEQAQRDGLEDAILAEIADVGISVRDLHEALSRRQKVLLEESSEDVQLLRQRLMELDEAKAHLRELPRHFRLWEGAIQDLRETEEALGALVAKLGAPQIETYQKLRGDQASLLDRLTGIRIEREAIAAELGDLLELGDVDDLHQAAVALAGSADPNDLNSRLSEVASSIAETERSLRDTEEELRSARARRREEESAISRAVKDLNELPSLDWIRRSEVSLPNELGPVAEQIEKLSSLRFALEALREDISGLVNDQDAAQLALTTLAGRLRNDSMRAAGTPWDRLEREFTTYYEQAFAEQLSAPEVRRALFEDGQEVVVDLEKLTTSWMAATGDAISRPLEAFSSGEKAFAYSRVQLQRVASIESHNKVVFLDEFGAFVARDRLQQLLAFIRNRVLGKTADQVVLVLPLTHEVRGVNRQAVDREGYFVDEP